MVIPKYWPKYARLEIEKRTLVRRELLPPLKDLESWLIEDRYFIAGRLRLRKMTCLRGSGAERVYKLCKKYGRASEYVEPIANIYLTTEEYEALLAVAGVDLVKQRFYYEFAGRRFGIDQFGGDLSGLFLCEIEAPSVESLAAVNFPPFSGRDVSGDEYFSGANLARIREFDWTKVKDSPG